MQPRQNWCWHGCTKATPFRASQQMGQLHSVSVAMFALRGGLGRAEDELRSCSPSLALALALPKGVARCKRQRGHGHSLSRGAEGRKKCPGPSRRTPSRLPEPHRPPHGRPGGTFPRTAHLRCCKRAPRCPAARARQGRGNTGDGSGTGTESCRRQPPKHHPAPGEASLHPPHLAGTLGRSPGTSQAGPGSAGARR